jgi:hypothetical protein
MFMGALLLLATVLTWGTGLMMSPHGETVVNGTEHFRPSIVTFKRNGAIGTLILCALAAWLLFPRRLPKWPARDWALIVLLAFLSGSSIYTLFRLPASALHGVSDDKSLAITNMNIDWNVSGPSSDPKTMNTKVAPVSKSNRVAVPLTTTATASEANGGAGPDEQGQTAEANVTEEQPDSDSNVGFHSGGDEPIGHETDQNSE